MEYASASTDRRLFTTEPAVGWIAVERGLDSRETPLSAIVSRANDPGECADQSRFPRFRQGFILREQKIEKEIDEKEVGISRPLRRRENSSGFRARESSQFLSFQGERREGGKREKVGKNQ